MRSFIKKHYGTQLRMSKQLGISNQTITNWMKSNPRGMLKYIPEIVSKVDTTEREIVWEVMFHEKIITDDKSVIV
jgi:DNA-binding XRE family transcriptional regulator|tara:strand:+ start:277 stop:501 length:225 start_codon:yes stop_codon:yes gene_type:complete